MVNGVLVLTDEFITPYSGIKGVTAAEIFSTSTGLSWLLCSLFLTLLAHLLCSTGLTHHALHAHITHEGI